MSTRVFWVGCGRRSQGIRSLEALAGTAQVQDCLGAGAWQGLGREHSCSMQWDEETFRF